MTKERHSRRNSRADRAAPRTRLNLEALEPRVLLSGLSWTETRPDGQELLVEAHPITDGELRAMRERWGEAEEGQNYNTIIDGHGTGFRPPTAEEWEQLGSTLLVVDSIQTTNDKLGAPTAIDWTTSEYFPPIRSQGMEGSCTTWAFAYYTKTFQEAREHGWDVSAGGWDMIFSPDFVYHQINGGTDGGSAGSRAVSIMDQIGAATWAEMPYNDADSTSWPDESAWREAAMYRASGGILTIDVSSDLSTLKDLLASGNLAQLSIDASDMYEMATLENFHNLDVNHANTIVGYDENWEYVEMGEVRHGAFKIANSWGDRWAEEADNDGCWWISYEALKQRVGSVTYFEDRIAYNPTTVAVFEIDHPVRGDTTVVVAVGQQYSPTDTRTFPSPAWSCDGDDPYPTGAIVFDITDLNDDVESGNNFFISVYDTGSASTGDLQHFSVEHYLDYVNGTLDVTRTSPDPLVITVEDDTIYAELFLDSGTPAVIAHRPSRTTVSPTSLLTFDFDATMDVTSFGIAADVVSFTGPAGDLSSQFFANGWLDHNTLYVRFMGGSAEGQYEMVIGPNILDSGGKAMDQNQNGVHGEMPGDTYTATFTIDFATPTLSVDLQSASDTGVSDTDNITMATQPWYDITVNTGGTLEIDWDGDDTVDQSHSVSAAGTNAYQPSAPLSEGYYPVAVKFTDTSGDVVTSTRGTTIDTGAPGAPAPPDLEAASDSGISDSDDVTAVLSPTFSVSSTDEYLRLYRGAALASGSYESGGAVTAQMEPEGTWTYVVRAVDTAGNISAASSGLEVTIDRAAPADPVAPDLQSGSDSGVSDADNLTNVLSPTFNVASADPYFRFYRGGIQISSGYEAGAIFTAAGETEGIWDYTVAAVDAAGNESPASAVLTVEIETTTPAAPNVPDLQAGSDSGVSDAEDRTAYYSENYLGSLVARGDLDGDVVVGGNLNVLQVLGGDLNGDVVLTGSNIGTVLVRSIGGGGGRITGDISADGDIGAVLAVGGDLTGDVEAESGYIGRVLAQALYDPHGSDWVGGSISGDITAGQWIGSVQAIRGGGIASTIDAGTWIGLVQSVGGDIVGTVSATTGYIGRVLAQGIWDGTQWHGGSVNADISAGNYIGAVLAVGGDITGDIESTSGYISRVLARGAYDGSGWSGGSISGDITAGEWIGSVQAIRGGGIASTIDAGTWIGLVQSVGGDIVGTVSATTGYIGRVLAQGIWDGTQWHGGSVNADISAGNYIGAVLAVNGGGMASSVQAGNWIGQVKSIGDDLDLTGGRSIAAGSRIGIVQVADGSLLGDGDSLAPDISVTEGQLGVVSVSGSICAAYIRAESVFGSLYAGVGLYDSNIDAGTLRRVVVRQEIRRSNVLADDMGVVVTPTLAAR